MGFANGQQSQEEEQNRLPVMGKKLVNMTGFLFLSVDHNVLILPSMWQQLYG
jgi:hypothetical protein